MATLSNLPGTSMKELPCIFVKTAHDFKKLSPTLALTNAGDSGALSIWIKDNGLFCCEAYRYRATVEEKEFSDINSVKEWWKEWRKKIA